MLLDPAGHFCPDRGQTTYCLQDVSSSTAKSVTKAKSDRQTRLKYRVIHGGGLGETDALHGGGELDMNLRELCSAFQTLHECQQIKISGLPLNGRLPDINLSLFCFFCFLQ